MSLALNLLAAAGAASLALGAMLAVPLRRLPPFAPIEQGAMKLDMSGLPDLSRFQARDGTWLAYRLYPASGERVAILAHGSTGLSQAMNGIGKALAAAGVTAVALDVRGHGASGGRGDIGYIGQLQHDLADLLDHLGAERPQARFQLLGHSLGAGFVARIAGTAVGRRFERFHLLAPFLGPKAPSTGPGNQRWASPDIPRLIALSVLRAFGVTLGESLPVIAFATEPDAGKFLTPVYSYRLLTDYAADYDWRRAKAVIAAQAPKIRAICGLDDELMLGHVLARELTPLGVAVKLLPGVDHMASLEHPDALGAIVEAVAAP